MLRASWRSLMGRKLRLLLSAFAIILGVAFVAGSLIFTDTLGKAFVGITQGTVGDVIVSPKVSVAAQEADAPPQAPIPGSLVATLAKVPGAARADGNVVNYGTFVVSKKGKLIGGQGAPGIAFNVSGGPAAHGLELATLQSGRWPTKANEIVLDVKTAQTSGYLVGEDVNLVSTGKEPRITARLVGTIEYGSGGLVGASLVGFDTATTQRLFMDGKNEFTDIWVSAEPGVSQADLKAAVSKVIPQEYQAKTGDESAKEAATGIQRGLSFLTTFLLVFAGISLVVGTFLIVNTFSILVAQRSRELALLRALGARRQQVARSVLFEAFVIALVGSTLGLGFGVVLAMGIKALFATFGLDLSGSPLVFAPRTFIASYAVGLTVTLVAAYLPARRAGKVPPMAALRDDAVLTATSLAKRVWFGGALTLAGAVALGLGLFGSTEHPVWFVGGGIFGLVIGLSMISPLVGRPVVAGLGAAYRAAFGAVGRMAQQNAERNPRRTAATASALMIGVTLVSLMSVLGASAKASVDKVIEDQFAADYVVSNAIGQSFSPAIADQVKATDGVGTVARVRFGPVELAGKPLWIAAVDAAPLAAILKPQMTTGSFTALTDSTILYSDEQAASDHVAVGDTVEIKAGTGTRSLRIAGLYKTSPLLGDRMVTIGLFEALGQPKADNYLYITRAADASAATVGASLEKLLADLPLVSVKDQQAFAEEQRQPIDRLLLMIYALLGLAVIIAVLGIVNTLALSVVERTREFGLLRAVGLSRRQLRTMLRLESIAIAVLGAVLGVVLGVGCGVALQRSLADQGVDVLAIPWGTVGGFLAVSAVVGVLAAIWPGRRAAKLDILRAITTE